MKTLLALFFVATISVFFTTLAHPYQPPLDVCPDVVMDVLDPSLEYSSVNWQTEIGRRFHNAVGVFCHGSGLLIHHWAIAANRNWDIGNFVTVEDLINQEQEKFPGRTIILLCCNPAHDVLHGYPNVWYAPSDLWIVPDRNVLDDNNFLRSGKLEGLFSMTTLPSIPSFSSEYSRWRSDPDAVGNIWEFISAK